MPQRFFRPGIRTSERWNSVSRDAQALYVAVLTLVDDYGRYDGRPAVLCGDAFSVWNEKNPRARINPQETAALCCELHKARLIHFYDANGKKCLQMLQWEERIREGAKEKWPPCKNINEINIPQESAAERCVPLPPSSPPSPSPSSPPSPIDVVTPEKIYEAYPLKVGKPAALKSITKAMQKVDPKSLLALTQAYATRRGGDLSFTPHPSTWFNQERFNDDPSTWDRAAGNGKSSHKPDYEKGF
jgi:hypothetical protein